MKNIKLLFILFIGFLTPIYANAYELVCDGRKLEYKDYFYCRIRGNENIAYESVKGTLSIDSNVSCTALKYDSGLNSTNTESLSFDLKGTSKETSLVVYKCQIMNKLDKDLQVQFKVNDFQYKIENDEKIHKEVLRSDFINIKKYEVPTTTTKAKPKDTSNGNSLLQYLHSNELDVNFSRFITEYNIEVLYETSQFTLQYTPVNKDAKISIDGDKNLKVGLNVIDIYVTSPDGKATTCYTLNITRLARGEAIYYPESDSTLASLTIPGYAINFEKEILEYSIHVTSDIDTVEVNAVPTYEKAVVSVTGNNDLKNGSIISVNVKSKDGNNNTRYKITVVKDAPKMDYTPYIILGILGVLIIVIIILIIRSSQKRKKDPLLSIKNDKRKINKGDKLDYNAIPDASGDEAPSKTEPNVLDLTNTTVEPIHTTQIQDTNLNVVQDNIQTLDLKSPNQVTPIPVLKDEEGYDDIDYL